VVLAVGNDELDVGNHELDVGSHDVAPFGQCRGRDMCGKAREAASRVVRTMPRERQAREAWESHAEDVTRAGRLRDVTWGTRQVREGLSKLRRWPRREWNMWRAGP